MRAGACSISKVFNPKYIFIGWGPFGKCNWCIVLFKLVVRAVDLSAVAGIMAEGIV